MEFLPQDINGVSLQKLTKLKDDRGYFARSFCEAEFQRTGHLFHVHQINISFTEKEGTLRGLHFQSDPTPDPKIVRCLSGKIFDVVVDLRPKSDSYLAWIGIELSDANELSLIIPGGCAHGFLTLSENSTLLYTMGAPYVPALASGVRWNDPAFDVEWPQAPMHMNDRDANYPDYIVVA